MATISVSLPSDGQTIDAADYNVPINTIVAAINGGLDSNNITAGGVVPNSLQSGTGTSWAWQTYTPTWTNLTVGNGTSTGKYIQIGKTVFFRASVVFGSTSVMSSPPSVTLPVTSVSYTTAYTAVIGDCYYWDTSASFAFPGTLSWLTTGTAEPETLNASGTFLQISSVSATNPFTWATGDVIFVKGYYEAA